MSALKRKIFPIQDAGAVPQGAKTYSRTSRLRGYCTSDHSTGGGVSSTQHLRKPANEILERLVH